MKLSNVKYLGRTFQISGTNTSYNSVEFRKSELHDFAEFSKCLLEKHNTMNLMFHLLRPT